MRKWHAHSEWALPAFWMRNYKKDKNQLMSSSTFRLMKPFRICEIMRQGGMSQRVAHPPPVLKSPSPLTNTSLQTSAAFKKKHFLLWSASFYGWGVEFRCLGEVEVIDILLVFFSSAAKFTKQYKACLHNENHITLILSKKWSKLLVVARTLSKTKKRLFQWFHSVISHHSTLRTAKPRRFVMNL